MEHRASENIKEQLHTEFNIKTEMEEPVPAPTYLDIKKDPNHLIKDGLEDCTQDGNGQQCVQGASPPAGTGGLIDFCSASLGDFLKVKHELSDMDIGPTVFQHMDIHYTTDQQNNSAVTEEYTNIDDYYQPKLRRKVKKEKAEYKLKARGNGNDSDVLILPRYTFKKSIVWIFFDLAADKKKASCKLCKKNYIYHGNTSNLKEHIKRVHPVQYHAEENRRAGTAQNSLTLNPTLNTFTQSENTAAAQAENSAPGREVDIQVEDSSTQIIAGSKRKWQQLGTSEETSDLPPEEIARLDKALVTMIVKDFQPLSMVDDTDFRKFVYMLNPQYNLPSRKTLSKKLLPAYHKSIEEKLAFTLKAVNHISLTSDYWQSNNNETYLSLTAHFIFENKLHSSNLATQEMIFSHTATNVATVVADICNKWEINPKIVTVVTDDAASMKKAVAEHLNKDHHSCVAYMINLTVNDAISSDQDLAAILAKCRAIVTYFKLKEKQAELKLPELKLKLDIITRWNSTYIMLERLLVAKQPLSLVLAELTSDKAPDNLSGGEWATIKDCGPILKPFVELTEELSGEKYVTMSTVVPLIRCLQYEISNVTPATPIGERLKISLIDLVSCRLSALETNEVIAKATFLDPRFKTAGFGKEDNARLAQQWVTDELTELFYQSTAVRNGEQSTDSNIQPVSTYDNKDSVSLWSDFDEKVSKQTAYEPRNPCAHFMVRQYVGTNLLNRKHDPFKYWQDHANVFPGLYVLAKKYLSIPATSVPSERLFSKAGYELYNRRNHLSSKNIDDIMFLHINI